MSLWLQQLQEYLEGGKMPALFEAREKLDRAARE